MHIIHFVSFYHAIKVTRKKGNALICIFTTVQSILVIGMFTHHAIKTAGTTISLATGADGFPNIIGATNPPPNPKRGKRKRRKKIMRGEEKGEKRKMERERKRRGSSVIDANNLDNILQDH